MAFRTFDFSSDVGVEGEAPTIEAALIELGRAMVQVLTDHSGVEPKDERLVDVTGAHDWPGTAVAWINELIFLFDTDQFLLADGELQTSQTEDGLHRLRGKVRGERFDPGRHRAGRGVKAATFHDAEHHATESSHRLRLVLDL